MAQDQVPDDFDWVAAQANCSAAAMFERLLTSVRHDVERRNLLLKEVDVKFEFEELEGGCEVSRVVPSPFTGSKVDALVRFEREGRRIHVRGEDVDVDFTAVVALDPGGVCRFVVAEAMYSEWEIRRMALEQLFFEEHDETE